MTPKTLNINRKNCGLCCTYVVTNQPRRWSSRQIGIKFTFLSLIFTRESFCKSSSFFLGHFYNGNFVKIPIVCLKPEKFKSFRGYQSATPMAAASDWYSVYASIFIIHKKNFGKTSSFFLDTLVMGTYIIKIPIVSTLDPENDMSAAYHK